MSTTSTGDLDSWLQSHRARRRAKQAVGWSIAITLALYFIPFGFWVAYPLMLLSTLVHELGHGLAALLVGGDFDKLVIFADGSGVARHSLPGGASSVARAIVSAGGLVGPAVAAAFGFAAGRKALASRWFLGGVAVFLMAMIALFVRNPFGIGFTALVAAGLGWVAVRRSPAIAQLVLVFLSVQLALSVFSRGDYLFTDVARTGAGVLPSDTAHMAQALGGPYWAWGLACGAFSIGVLALGVWWFGRVLKTKP